MSYGLYQCSRKRLQVQAILNKQLYLYSIWVCVIKEYLYLKKLVNTCTQMRNLACQI